MIERAKANFATMKDKPCSFKKILLLDDEPYNIEVLMSILKCLQLRGYPDSVDCCYNGDEALEFIK